MSTVLVRSRARGPSFYFYLFNPYVVARLATRFVSECIKEWWQAWQQKRRNDPYRVSSRSPAYALLRGFMGPLMQDLATFMVINDVLRGVPAIYALYAGYDDLAHFAGQHSTEAFDALHEIDRYFVRIERVLQYAPRPYHIIVLSDHGQTQGRTFENTHKVSLEGLVEALMEKKGDVYAAQKTHETWDKLSVLLSEATLENTRTASVLKTMLRSKFKEGVVQVGPQSDNEKARAKEVLVLASGCAGLIYFSQAETRLSYEHIQEHHPELVLGLVKHPGIGFVLVKSEKNGNIVIGKKGIHFLDDRKVEGEDPLTPFGPNAAWLLEKEAKFSNCPDILVNTDYDPLTQEMCGFEDQASHHGGLGGPQSQAFVMHSVSLDPGDEPIVSAECLYRVMHGWRDQVQN
jgi:putative membrane protein